MHPNHLKDEEKSKAWTAFIHLFCVTAVLTFFAFPIFWLKVPLTDLNGSMVFWGVSLIFGFVVVVPAFLIGAAFFFLLTPIFETCLPCPIAFIAAGTIAAFFGVFISIFLIVLFSGGSSMLSVGFGIGVAAAIAACLVSTSMIVKDF